MKHYLINGFNSKVGGGLSVFVGFLRYINSNKWDRERFFVIVPDTFSTTDEGITLNENVTLIRPILFTPAPIRNPYYYYLWLLAFIRRNRIDVIFNFADIIVPTRTRQIYYFDWPYLIYPESCVWQRMGFKERLIRSMKVKLINSRLLVPTIVLAQTNVVKERLLKYTKARNIRIIHGPIFLPNSICGSNHQNNSLFLKSPEWKYLLCLSGSAIHKNLNFLVDFAILCKANRKKYAIVLTLDSEDSGAHVVLERIAELSLFDYFINIGWLNKEAVRDAIYLCDALIFPTLLETCGLPYHEAMFLEKPIFSSDLDFAHEACEDAAFYFSPTDPNHMYDVVDSAINNQKALSRKIEQAKSISARYPTENQIYLNYVNIIRELSCAVN
jgi:glycosyltransferase involved in cell wall biosynthesis